MKQSVGLCCILCTQLISLVCQVQGGIITNQQQALGSGLPPELNVDSIASPSISVSATNGVSSINSNSSPGKNETRTGRVMYTASYSNVRISSKEPKDPKNLKLFQVMSKKPTPAAAKIVPVLQPSTSTTTSTTPTSTSTTSSTTISSTTTTTSTSTTPSPPAEEEIPRAGEVEGTLPIDIIELIEDSEPDHDDAGEVVTETILGSTASGNSASEEIDEPGVTEQIAEE